MTKTLIGLFFATILASSVSFAKGDIAAGKAKAATCVACHGANGKSSIPVYPNLAGQKAQYLVKQMKDFKSGKRVDGIMKPMVAGLSDKDMENIAAYYESLSGDAKGGRRRR